MVYHTIKTKHCFLSSLQEIESSSLHLVPFCPQTDFLPYRGLFFFFFNSSTIKYNGGLDEHKEYIIQSKLKIVFYLLCRRIPLFIWFPLALG